MLTVLVFMSLPSLWLLLGFGFDESIHDDEGYKSAVYEKGQGAFFHLMFNSSWEQFIPWFVHMIAATFLFSSFSIIACMYLFFVFPPLEAEKLEPKSDLKWKMRCCYLLVLGCPTAITIRGFHIVHSNYIWAVPLLFVEIGFCTVACMAVLCGNFLTMREIDATNPIAIFPFNLLSNSKINRKRRKSASDLFDRILRGQGVPDIEGMDEDEEDHLDTPLAVSGAQGKVYTRDARARVSASAHMRARGRNRVKSADGGEGDSETTRSGSRDAAEFSHDGTMDVSMSPLSSQEASESEDTVDGVDGAPLEVEDLDDAPDISMGLSAPAESSGSADSGGFHVHGPGPARRTYNVVTRTRSRSTNVIKDSKPLTPQQLELLSKGLPESSSHSLSKTASGTSATGTSTFHSGSDHSNDDEGYARRKFNTAPHEHGLQHFKARSSESDSKRQKDEANADQRGSAMLFGLLSGYKLSEDDIFHFMTLNSFFKGSRGNAKANGKQPDKERSASDESALPSAAASSSSSMLEKQAGSGEQRTSLTSSRKKAE